MPAKKKGGKQAMREEELAERRAERKAGRSRDDAPTAVQAAAAAEPPKGKGKAPAAAPVAAAAAAAAAEAPKKGKKKKGTRDSEPRGAGVMTPCDAGGGAAASAAASAGVSSTHAGQATQNACIIVSAGGGGAGGRRHKWPEYVFLKGSGYNTKGKSKANARDVKIEDFSLQVPGKVLIKNATLTLAFGHKYGLLGRNGIGKSVLLRSISERESGTPFGRVPANIRILHVQQEVSGDDRPPLDTVLSADIERTWLMAEVERLTKLERDETAKAEAASAARAAGEHVDDDDDDDDEEEEEEEDEDEEEETYNLADLYERLREIEAHKAVPRASTILSGLGFDLEEIKTKPTKSYSGGWRMRIALAQALFLQPELLILDEPTNHLDLQAVIWLESYLAGWSKTLLLVSHDASFVSNSCDHIVHFHNQTLSQYKGDYWSFLKARQQELAHLHRQVNRQEKKDEKMRELRNKGRSGKAAVQVKSRERQAAKDERVELEQEEAIPHIIFPEPGQLGLPVLQFQEVDFGYDPAKPLFRHLDFGVYMDSRIGLVGPNGAGKTTLVKLMSGDLQETRGFVYRNSHLVLARFHQHHVDQLDMDMTPIEYMQAHFSSAQTQDIRQFLGKFGVKGSMALQRIGTLSGGQRSRLVFAEICYRNPHILLLDEPTNHLDMDTIEVLIEALRDFKGGVILISHHQRLIEAACKEVWVVKDNRVTPFDGDFADYKKMLLKSMPATTEDDDDDDDDLFA